MDKYAAVAALRAGMISHRRAFSRGFALLSLLAVGLLMGSMPAFADTAAVVSISPLDMLSNFGNLPVSVVGQFIAVAIAIATAVMLCMPAPGASSSAAYVTAYNIMHVIANLKAPPAVTVGAAAPSVAADTTKSTSTGLPTAAAALLLLLGVGAIVACTAAQTAQAEQIASVVCQDDAAVEPVVTTVAMTGLAGATVARIAATDQALVHPLVVDACKAVSATAKPVSVTTN